MGYMLPAASTYHNLEHSSQETHHGRQ